MTNEEIQALMNSTFSGLAIFCRDLDLEEHLVSKYQPHQIIMERGFTDVSHKIGGMTKNCRYLVASSQGRDLPMFSQNPELGHIMIQSGAFYKVLDIQKQNGKTQILLLNIPKEGVAIFGRSRINLEDQIVEKGLEIFRKTLTSDPVEALQTQEWIHRTSLPLGMDNEGVFFLATPPPGHVASISETPPNTPSNSEKTNHPIQEDSKPKKRGFWDKLFGK